MTSTFMGLEIARRGMTAQQSALNVTSQNVANASTPGYTRQRVNFKATEPYPSPGINAPMITGQMGTGVTADSIQRVRESFLDVQYRGENNNVGYWQTRSDSLSKMESIMNEPSDSGLSNTMDQFWQSLQDLAVDPTNSGARSVVRQRGEAVADTFNYLHNSLSDVQKDQKDQVDVTLKEVNSIVYQLDQINSQIGQVEPHGYLPNDLYDERDRLVDQLSSLVNIKVEYQKSGGNPDPQAEGKAIVKLVNDSGTEMGVLLGASGYNELKVNYNGADKSVKTITLGSASYDFSKLHSSGKLSALIESYGYEKDGAATGIYTDMLNELDNMAYTFATEFNKVHEEGVTPNDLANVKKLQDSGVTSSNALDAAKEDISFFADQDSQPIANRKGFAGRIQVSQKVDESLDNIATAGGPPSTATIGDATNVSKLADVINQKYNYKPMNQDQTSETADFRNYYQNIIGSMGVNSQEATRLTTNSTNLQQAVDQKRQSVSSVSLDEEMTNMIQYQHAYSASAKMISIQDEILNTIINGMGVGK